MHSFKTSPPIVKTNHAAVSDSFFDRLIAFYQRQPVAREHFSPVWQGMTDLLYRPIISALEAGDREALKHLLLTSYETNFAAGLDWPLADEVKYRDWFNHELLETAAACGVIPVFNPEQPVVENNFTHEGLLAAVEVVLGGTLSHKGGGGMKALVIGDRLVPGKLMESARHFMMFKRLLRGSGTFLEIGGGCGFVGYAVHSISTDSYASVDLPLISVFQAYLLANAIGENAVWLAGEPWSDIRIQIYGLRDWPKSAAVVLSCNSFPEIPWLVQEQYLAKAAGLLPVGGAFVSVNHESDNGGQRRLFAAMQDFPSFHLETRAKSFGRTGYVQEVWRKT